MEGISSMIRGSDGRFALFSKTSSRSDQIQPRAESIVFSSIFSSGGSLIRGGVQNIRPSFCHSVFPSDAYIVILYM